jgi:hypothetical protein
MRRVHVGPFRIYEPTTPPWHLVPVSFWRTNYHSILVAIPPTDRSSSLSILKSPNYIFKHVYQRRSSSGGKAYRRGGRSLRTNRHVRYQACSQWMPYQTINDRWSTICPHWRPLVPSVYTDITIKFWVIIVVSWCFFRGKYGFYENKEIDA